ncbi:hypothetical protein [Raineyella fluvialis]|uniref:Uncharacterized protein n=1 Tax=Raineyella fluvialis TaxID=2662261 RepID=A0A5Q2F7J6_9ACTN|nr:hypothetical protein [Raineyella fluvialis]QGF22441.1 hypothetical protein Rai3103_00655 [Raineyella fluvialis]
MNNEKYVRFMQAAREANDAHRRKYGLSEFDKEEIRRRKEWDAKHPAPSRTPQPDEGKGETDRQSS